MIFTGQLRELLGAVLQAGVGGDGGPPGWMFTVRAKLRVACQAQCVVKPGVSSIKHTGDCIGGETGGRACG